MVDEAIRWILYVDTTLKNYSEYTDNPFPTIFADKIEYLYFIDDGIDLIPLVRDIFNIVMEKYNFKNINIMKLYLILIYFLCIKFYTDTCLSTPIKTIFKMFEKVIDNISVILQAEIKILQAIDYTFPLSLQKK